MRSQTTAILKTNLQHWLYSDNFDCAIQNSISASLKDTPNFLSSVQSVVFQYQRKFCDPASLVLFRIFFFSDRMSVGGAQHTGGSSSSSTAPPPDVQTQLENLLFKVDHLKARHLCLELLFFKT